MPSNTWDALRDVLSPDIRHALSHNFRLDTGTLQSARALQGHPELLTSAVQKRISDINRTLAELEQEKEKLSDPNFAHTAMDAAYAALCAPVRGLPADILREIALHSMDDCPSPAGNCAPVNLSHVSTAWRNVVLNSAHFWTTLYLRVKTTDYGHLMQRVQAANTWFARAASFPLNVFLYVECNIGTENDGVYNFRVFLNALGRWAPRIQRLGIGGRNWLNVMANFVDVDWDLSRLEQVDILGQRADFVNEMEGEMNVLQSLNERINLFRRAKQLTSIVAVQEITAYFPSFKFLPWNQITDLALSEGTADGIDLETLLTACRKLRSASLSWSNCWPDSLLDLRTHKIKKLERLQLAGISICNYTEIGQFFTKVSFPQLIQLSITIFEMHEEPPEDMPKFTSISTFPSLRKLYLGGNTELPTDFILDILRKTPELRTFGMEFYFHHQDRLRLVNPDLNKLCEALTVNDDNQVLPLLEECAFDRRVGSGIYPLDIVAISRFIHSRSQQYGPDSSNLHKITFMGPFGFMSDLREEVARLSIEESSLEIDILPQFQSRNINRNLKNLFYIDLPLVPFAPKGDGNARFENDHTYYFDEIL